MKKSISLSILFLVLLVPQIIKAFELPFDLSGFYASANVSCNFATHDRHHHVKVSFDPGVFVSPAIGYRFCNGLRVEGEFGYRYNHLKRLNYYGTSFRVGGHLETFSGLANVYYDFPLCWCLTSYVGAGIGYAYTRNEMHQGYVFAGKGHDSGFAWQVMAGLAYPICDKIDLAIEYRFFINEGISRVQNHDIGGSLRYNF